MSGSERRRGALRQMLAQASVERDMKRVLINAKLSRQQRSGAGRPSQDRVTLALRQVADHLNRLVSIDQAPI